VQLHAGHVGHHQARKEQIDRAAGDDLLKRIFAACRADHLVPIKPEHAGDALRETGFVIYDHNANCGHPAVKVTGKARL
jgi:hypothetical protein